MPLQTQLVPVQLVGGVNEKEDALVSNRPQLMLNCWYAKTGAVSKRQGYSCIAPFRARALGGTPEVCKKLAVYGDTLVRIGASEVDVFALTSNNTDWSLRGEVSEAIVQSDSRFSVNSSALREPSFAYAADAFIDYLIIGYQDDVGPLHTVLVDIVDTRTGARVVGRRAVATTSGFPFELVCTVASGHTAGVFWSDPNTSEIRGVYIDLYTLTFGISALAAASLPPASVSRFGCAMTSPTSVVFVVPYALGPTVIAIADTITAGVFDAQFPDYQMNADTGISAVQVVNAPTRVWVAYAQENVFSASVSVGTLTPALALENAPVAVDSISATTPIISHIGIEPTGADAAFVVYDTPSIGPDGTAFALQLSAITTVDAIRTVFGAQWVTSPLNVGAKTYGALRYGGFSSPGNVGSLVVVDLQQNGVYPDSGSPRVVAHAYPSQCVYPQGLQRWVRRSDGNASVPLLTIGTQYGETTKSAITLLFGDSVSRSTVELLGSLYISGGVISGFDGIAPYDVGFIRAPMIVSAAATVAVGGLTPASSYGYQVVYSWQDNTGDVHRSAPSVVATVVLSAAESTVALEVTPCSITNKTGRSVNVDIYRTLANGNTYFYAGSIASNPFAPLGVQTYVDSTGDTPLSTRPTIYTTGGVKASEAPSGSQVLLAWSGSLMTSGLDDGAIWISRELLAGEGPAFSSDITIPEFDGGAVTGLAMLDSNPVVFKKDSLYYLEGSPPTDLGVSNIGTPRRLQSEGGCSDAVSIVETPDGVARMTPFGLHLLDRSLVDRPIGKGVESSYRGRFVGAARLISEGTVRWMQSGTGGFEDTLDYDYFHSQMYGAPVWSRGELYDVQPNALPEAGDPVAAVVYRGRFTWMSRSGYLYQETDGFFDTTYSGAKVYVPMTYESANIKTGGIAGFVRVRNVHVTADFRGPHALTIRCTTSDNSEQRDWTVAEVSQLPLGNTEERATVHVAYQKCQWMKVLVTDSATSADGLPGNGEGPCIRDISLEVGVKGFAKLPSANSK
jgi:hypothetical protein